MSAEGPLSNKAAAQRAAPSCQGKIVGRFRLLSPLGKGQMGAVFRAEDISLKRHVALKILPSFQGDAAKAARRKELFLREARSMASLEHPHVAQIYEVGDDKGRCFLAMELLEGGDLQRALHAAGPLEVPRACLLIAEAAEGIAEAHRVGVIHRDIKPSNLMLSRAGRCKVTDFGLALIDDPNSPRTTTSNFAGTPYYMAPEIARRQSATAAADVYSLGATLWHLLTGDVIFPGQTADEVCEQHLNSPVPDLRERFPDWPERLIELLESTLRKDPSERPTAAQMAQTLRVFTVPVGSSSGSASGSKSGEEESGIAVHVKPTSASSYRSPANKFKPSSSFNPWLWIGGGTTVGLLLGLMLLPFLLKGDAQEPKPAKPSAAAPKIIAELPAQPPAKQQPQPAAKSVPEKKMDPRPAVDPDPPRELVFKIPDPEPTTEPEPEPTTEPEPETSPDTPFPIPIPAPEPETPSDAIAWDQITDEHLDQAVTVEGTILVTGRSGGLFFLNFDPDRSSKKLYLFVTANGWDEPPHEYFKGKRVRATGTVVKFKDRLQIKVEQPEQLQLAE